GAGALHILIFAGFLILVAHTVSLLVLGFSSTFRMPGSSEGAGHLYAVARDYAVTTVFLLVVVAAVRRAIFKPARYRVPAKYGQSHMADAIFLLGLIALLMAADSFFEASKAAGLSRLGQPTESLAILSLPWMLTYALSSVPVMALAR